MPSSSIIAHRMRRSPSAFSDAYAEEPAAPSISSFIDGLSPHPSVNAHPFLSPTPPPLIQGLERHPDAPKSFATELLMEYAGLPTYNDSVSSQWEDQTRYSQFTDDGLPGAGGASSLLAGSSLFDTEMVSYPQQPSTTNSIAASRYSQGGESGFKPSSTFTSSTFASTRFRSRLSAPLPKQEPVREEEEEEQVVYDGGYEQSEDDSSFFVNQLTFDTSPTAYYYPELPVCNDISPTVSVLSDGSTTSTDSDSTASSDSQLDIILSPSSSDSEANGFSTTSPFDDPISNNNADSMTSPVDTNSALSASIQTARRQKPTLAVMNTTNLPLVTLVDADEEDRGNPCSPMYNPFSPMTPLFGEVGRLSRFVPKSRSRSPVSAKPGAVSRLLMEYFRGVERA